MDRFKAKVMQFAAGSRQMSAPEREAMRLAMQAATELQDEEEGELLLERITEIGAARGRVQRKRESDRRTDAVRRQLVGARLPLEEAERCKACAARLGLSGYRFAALALEEACRRAEAGPEGVRGCPLAGGAAAESDP